VSSGGRTDAELISAHNAGDSAAFTELVERYRDRMWALAMRVLRDSEDAADALQDAFVSAFRAAGGFRGESRVSTWLHRIVLNACLDKIRTRKARRTVQIPEDGFEPGTHHAPARDPMAEAAVRMDVAQALACLPEQQRAAIVLVDVEGFAVAEAARALGLAEGTVKSRCARGRAKLATLLGYLREPGKVDVG
jgi:RNA polymerase sigma-70 factor (ECF subfamily)